MKNTSKPKTVFTPIVADDYTDGQTRRTTIQLCRMERGRLAAAAVVQFQGDHPVCRCEERLSPRLPAIVRLARIYRNRSIPQVFLPA